MWVCEPPLSPSVALPLAAQQALLWINDRRRPLREVSANVELGVDDVISASRYLERCEALLTLLFPELKRSRCLLDSPLHSADALPRDVLPAGCPAGRWLIKCDHALPMAGSIKARGGIYEILLHAEQLAVRAGLMRSGDSLAPLASAPARELFARHQVAVGSTGNLGLSIGLIATALGFSATVHMSSNARDWKKAKLRQAGVEVVEHNGDYNAAVQAGRDQSRGNPSVHFVDDENSRHLFLGYSVAAIRIQQQLAERGIRVDTQHPLFVYIPCGVGGAPGGITFGLRHLLGDHVHCFFAEPVAAPCMLARLASTTGLPISVTELGLDSRTAADGLAVQRASEFVAPLIEPLVSGIFTVTDDDLFADLYLLDRREGLRVEPSAAAALRGPVWVLESEPGQEYLRRHHLAPYLEQATHVVWTTGGAWLPEEEYDSFRCRGERVWRSRQQQNENQPL